MAAPANLTDLETERRVLSWAISDPSWLLDVGLVEHHFTFAEHQTVLLALLELAKAGQGADTVSLRAALLEANGRANDALLTELTSQLPEGGARGAALLKELAYLRSVKSQALQLVSTVQGGEREAIAKAISDLSAATDETPGRKTSYTAADMMTALAEMFQASNGARTYPGCDVLHGLIGDLVAGQEIVVGASTNVGKSSLLLRMALGLDARNVPVGIVSFEDDARVFGSRMVAAHCGVSSRRLMQGCLARDDAPLVMQTMSAIADRPLMFEHLPGGTDADASLAMTRMARNGARVVFVDYLQAITAAGKAQDRRNEIRSINTNLKATAQRVGVPMVLASQLRRPVDKEFSRPSKHDLKEAGDVENAADVVLLMWRESEDDLAPLNVWLAKSKSGGVGGSVTYRRDRSGVLRSEDEGQAEYNAQQFGVGDE